MSNKLNIPDEYWSEPITLKWLASLLPIATPHEMIFDFFPSGKLAIRKSDFNIVAYQTDRWHVYFPKTPRTKAQFLCFVYAIDSTYYGLRKYVSVVE